MFTLKTKTKNIKKFLKKMSETKNKKEEKVMEKTEFESVSEYYCPGCDRKHTDREWDRARGLINQETLDNYGGD